MVPVEQNTPAVHPQPADRPQDDGGGGDGAGGGSLYPGQPDTWGQG